MSKLYDWQSTQRHYESWGRLPYLTLIYVLEGVLLTFQIPKRCADLISTFPTTSTQISPPDNMGAFTTHRVPALPASNFVEESLTFDIASSQYHNVYRRFLHIPGPMSVKSANGIMR